MEKEKLWYNEIRTDEVGLYGKMFSKSTKRPVLPERTRLIILLIFAI